MKHILLSLFVLFSISTFAQTTVTIKSTAKVTSSQKYGTEVKNEDYTLTVSYGVTNLSFKTRDNQPPTNYSTKKLTDKYVIGSDQSGNYSFYDIKKKQFYYIDYFMNRYSVAGYGEGYSEIKQSVNKMMTKLKDGSTQKDVIQFLVKQTEYDF